MDEQRRARSAADREQMANVIASHHRLVRCITLRQVRRALSGGIITVPKGWSARGRRTTVSAQEEYKAIQDMDHEELEAALPKLREEAAKADARVHAAMERLAETAEVPTYVEVHEDYLVVDVRGVERAMKLLSRLHIPLEHVRGAEADPEIEHTLWRGWRIPGVHLPGVRFYDVHGHRDKTIVIHLKDETYDRLIVEVRDPAEVVAKINDAAGASSRS
jgi:hypothetical protein